MNFNIIIINLIFNFFNFSVRRIPVNTHPYLNFHKSKHLHVSWKISKKIKFQQEKKYEYLSQRNNHGKHWHKKWTAFIRWKIFIETEIPERPTFKLCIFLTEQARKSHDFVLRGYLNQCDCIKLLWNQCNRPMPLTCSSTPTLICAIIYCLISQVAEGGTAPQTKIEQALWKNYQHYFGKKITWLSWSNLR